MQVGATGDNYEMSGMFPEKRVNGRERGDKQDNTMIDMNNWRACICGVPVNAELGKNESTGSTKSHHRDVRPRYNLPHLLICSVDARGSMLYMDRLYFGWHRGPPFIQQCLT